MATWTRHCPEEAIRGRRAAEEQARSSFGPEALQKQHQPMLTTVLDYLRGLSTPRTTLWCYLIWWLFTVSRYFDPDPRLWLSSLGIAGIIGVALYLSTAYAKQEKTALDRWQVFRFFLMPFCVSSFAALIKDRGFVLVFHPTLSANLLAIGMCAIFCGFVALSKRLARPARPVSCGAPDPVCRSSRD